MSDRIKVLLVGHCMPDSFGLSRLIRRSAPGAKVERVNSDRALKKALAGASLLLVNRELDGRFSQHSGVELIGAVRDLNPALGLLLVSNFADAQRSALDAGAAPGFGKSEVRHPGAVAKIRAALGLDHDAQGSQKKPGAVAGH